MGCCRKKSCPNQENCSKTKDNGVELNSEESKTTEEQKKD